MIKIRTSIYKVLLTNIMEHYIHKLLQNLQNNQYGTVNLVLDGGAFSGSYILGSLYYIRELEKKNRIKINQLSGCSIGSILCVLYVLDDLDYITEMYGTVRDAFKQYGNLFIIQSCIDNLKSRLPENFYKKCNEKIYLSYYDIDEYKHVVKSNYDSNDDLLETLLKSSYIPYVCGETKLYKNRFLDGLKPHIFNTGKTLFVNLCMDYKCISGMLHVKNEVNNMERILNGILDVHSFFLQQTPTTMCYYIDEMNMYQTWMYRFRLLITECAVFTIYITHFGGRQLYIKLCSYPGLKEYMNYCAQQWRPTYTWIQSSLYIFMQYMMV